jgi:hypothetical protein
MDDEYLRDCFAMFAMNGLISRGSIWHVKEAYEIADAMIEERVKKEEQGIAVIRGKRNVRKA